MKKLIFPSVMNLELNCNDLWLILNESGRISWLWRHTVSNLFHRHWGAPFGCDVAHTKFPNTVLVASTNLDWSVKWKTNFLICKMDFPDILYYTFFLSGKYKSSYGKMKRDRTLKKLLDWIDRLISEQFVRWRFYYKDTGVGRTVMILARILKEHFVNLKKKSKIINQLNGAESFAIRWYSFNFLINFMSLI